VTNNSTQVAYDLQENLEGAGYQLGGAWTEYNGAPDEDQSTSGLSLEGSQCLYPTVEAGAESDFLTLTSATKVFLYMLVRFNDLMSATHDSIEVSDGAALLGGVIMSSTTLQAS
jgi:hypothetical protein